MFTALVQCPKLLGHCPSLESFDRLKGGIDSGLMQLWFCERFLGDSEMRGLLQVFEDGWVQFEHVKPSPRFDHSIGWTTETWALGNLVPNPVRRGSADWHSRLEQTQASARIDPPNCGVSLCFTTKHDQPFIPTMPCSLEVLQRGDSNTNWPPWGPWRWTIWKIY
jgi:hypothetical protein